MNCIRVHFILLFQWIDYWLLPIDFWRKQPGTCRGVKCRKVHWCQSSIVICKSRQAEALNTVKCCFFLKLILPIWLLLEVAANNLWFYVWPWIRSLMKIRWCAPSWLSGLDMGLQFVKVKYDVNFQFSPLLDLSGHWCFNFKVCLLESSEMYIFNLAC